MFIPREVLEIVREQTVAESEIYALVCFPLLTLFVMFPSAVSLSSFAHHTYRWSVVLLRCKEFIRCMLPLLPSLLCLAGACKSVCLFVFRQVITCFGS